MAGKKKAERATTSKKKAVPQPRQQSGEPEGSPPAPAGADLSPPSGEGEGRRPRFPVVGIGVSAGGIEALTEFLPALSADSGAVFVVVSHLDPEHKSALSEILAGMSPMPVREVEDGMTVEPNHVYVMPPNRDMVIAKGTLHLIPRVETAGPHLPVDRFLRSLAEDCKGQAIGVILSGTGPDGTRGLLAIKEEGGITFAQNETARYGGMPGSAIATGCVDFVLPPAQIAAELLRVARHPAQARPEAAAPPALPGEEDAFLQILRLLSDSTGVDFVHYKHATLRRRIERRLVLRQIHTLAEYLQYLRDDPAERKTLYEEVLIPVTGFFRNPDVFQALRTMVFPRFLENRPPNTPLRVWVPGCASGEEAYSLAICLLEYLGSAADAVPIKIFGTDISERAIEAARAGAYSEGIAADVSAARLERFFLKTDRGYEISKAVRDLCVFARQDVTKDPPFSQLDLISCRNLLIYLGPALQSRVLPIFHYALKPGGFLVLGNSETVGNFTDLFEVVDKKYKFYFRTATPSRLTFDYTPSAPTRAKVIVHEGEVERGRGLREVYREADRVVLADYAPPGVVVDEKLQVVQVRGDTGHYLKLAQGPPTADLLMLAREGLLGDLRVTFEQARRDNARARKDGVRVKANDHFREINLKVIPITDRTSGTRHFVILFEEARAAAGAGATVPRARVPVPSEEESAKDQEIRRLQHELVTTKDYLQSVIEEKEAANEELRAANEETVSANEELQSSNEELETAKEELQATNEELTTVNEELQNRIREARRLAMLVEASDDAVFGKTADGIITSWNRGAERLYGYAAHEAIGQSIFMLVPRRDYHQLEPGCRALVRLRRPRSDRAIDLHAGPRGLRPGGAPNQRTTSARGGC
jgi:two-component system CheB/CheR fusion protein